MAKQHNQPYRLYKRGDIYHAYISFVDQTGTRIQFRESTGRMEETAAAQYCLERIEKINQKSRQIANGEFPYVTIEEAFTRYFFEKGQYLSLPQQRLSRLVKLKKDLNITYLHEVNEPQVNLFIRKNKEQLSNATINRYLFLLSAVLTTAREEWKVKTSDVKISKFKLIEPAEKIEYIKNKEIFEKIISRAAPHLVPIIYTALITGLRLSNVLNLKWDQIDFTNRCINIKTKSRKKLGGKNASKPITDKLYHILMSIPRCNEYVFTYKNKHTKSFYTAWRNIFYKRDGRKRFTHELKDPELPYINFHILRHTHATWLLKKTKNLRTVKDSLGHANMNTTLKYAHACDEEVRQALESTFDI